MYRAEQYFNEGVNFARLGRYIEAVESYDKALAINPTNAEAWYLRGNALGHLGQYAKAIKSYDKALAICPNDLDAQKNRKIALQQQQEIKFCSSSLDRFGKSAEAESKPEKNFEPNTIIPWEKGYKIQNRYEIINIKEGGMGIVYIAHDHEWDQIFAIKTFQDKYLWDEDVIQRFMAEAETWTQLEKHTNIVFANMVQEIEGKPLLFLEYIDGGNLDQYIGNLSIEGSLDFAIQFCTGMEYAYQKLGVIHRDIKPGNVMVQKDPRFRFGNAYKITDFGLVRVLGDKFHDEFNKISTGIGTLPFMPPEQFPEQIQEKFSFKGKVTTRSDIYSFGVMLYLLLTGKLPINDMNEIFNCPPVRPKHLNPEIQERLDIVITKCLEKNPNNRYNDFTELKFNLIEIYNNLSGERYAIIGEKEPLTERDWNNKGVALNFLGKHREAIDCYDKALAIDPRFSVTWYNKGLALDQIGKTQGAIKCYGKALEMNPRDIEAWHNKGLALDKIGKPQEAIECYEKSLDITPRTSDAWSNKGLTFDTLGKPKESIKCYDKALEINPRNFNAWYNKGIALNELGKHKEAIECYDRALEIYPRKAEVWNNKGIALDDLGKTEVAIECYDRALEINPRKFSTWHNKGLTLSELGKLPEAIGCYDKALAIAPREANVWDSKGIALDELGKPQDAIECYNKALEIKPRHELAWHNKGRALRGLGKYQEAIVCFDKALEINPRYAIAWYSKGFTLHNLGKNEEAIGCIEKFIEVAPPEYFSEVLQ